MTGTPVSSPMRIKPEQQLSEMYSKCIVEPLISTPIAITASNAEVFFGLEDDEEEEEEEGLGVAVPLAGPSRREVAEMRSLALEDAWICEAAMSLVVK